MNKRSFLTTVLIAITFFMLLNLNQAKAQCNIEWSGDMSGSVPTTQTTRSQTSVYEAHLAIYGEEPLICEFQFHTPIYYCGESYGNMVTMLGGWGELLYGGGIGSPSGDWD